MIRKGFTAFLIACLVVLAGVDLLEDLDLPPQLSIHNPDDESQPNGSPGFDLVNNVLEFGTLARLSCFALWEHGNFTSCNDRCAVRNKASKIHKLNRVFLI
jgi:hypothetical protein